MVRGSQIDRTDSSSHKEVLNKSNHSFNSLEKNFESVQTSPADSSFEDPKDIRYKEKRQKNNIAAKRRNN